MDRDAPPGFATAAAESAPADAAGVASLRGRALRLAVVAVAGLALVYGLSTMVAGESAAALARIHPARVPLYLGLALLIVVLHAIRWRLVLDRLGVHPPVSALARQWLAARAVGSLVPSGTLAGEPVRAHLLRATGVPLATAAGAVTLDRGLELAGNVLAGPASIAAAAALGAGFTAGALTAVAAALAGLLLLALIYARARRGAPALGALLRPLVRAAGARRRLVVLAATNATRADDGLHRLITAHPRLVPSGLMLSLVIECLHLLELAALFAAFGLAVPLPLLLVSSVGIGVARAVPVTAALGTLEATQVSIFTLGGHPLALGLAVGLVLRVAETLWIVVGLGCLMTARFTSEAPRARA